MNRAGKRSYQARVEVMESRQVLTTTGPFTTTFRQGVLKLMEKADLIDAAIKAWNHPTQ
jgi:hypothetical protein